MKIELEIAEHELESLLASGLIGLENMRNLDGRAKETLRRVCLRRLDACLSKADLAQGSVIRLP